MASVNKLMVGVAVGAILGILYAPDKGSVTRRKLSQRGNDLREKLNDLRDSINEKVESFKEDVNDIAYQEMEIAETEPTIKPHAWQ